jgi:hypothetical protein
MVRLKERFPWPAAGLDSFEHQTGRKMASQKITWLHGLITPGNKGRRSAIASLKGSGIPQNILSPS